MTDEKSREIWKSIVAILEDKLQFGFLEKERSVVDARFSGGELTLVVSDDEAFDFFSADVNQQRLMIVSRPVASIEAVRVEKVQASPVSPEDR